MIGRVLAVAVGLACGLTASQAPEFAQQYRQRMGGAIDELRRVVARFDDVAQAAGETRDSAIRRLSDSADPLVRGQGEANAEIADRLARLERQRSDLVDAGPFARLVYTAKGADPALARATYLDFEPAWPATQEGLVTGGAGFLFGWGLIAVLRRTARRLTPRRRRISLKVV